MRMFSFTLVQKIEAHSEQIANQVAEEVRKDPQLNRMRTLDHEDLPRRAKELLENLGQWLVAKDPEIAGWSESLGRARCERSIPLHELIRALQIVKSRLIEFTREGMAETAMQIYAEEELEYRVGRFFDEVIYHSAKGYESAMRELLREGGRVPVGSSAR